MKNKITHGHKVTIGTLLMTLGIVYGDIGTSPLYTMKAIIGENNLISSNAIFGGVSLIFWTLTLQTTIKYVMITLNADNNGEGGIFSLYAIVRKMGRWLKIPAMIGGAALLADGIITPPITVTTAIEGLQSITVIPRYEILWIVIIIITVLFLFQRLGTEIVGKAFGPFMFIWFCMLAILGIVPILSFPKILLALSPHYALIFLFTNKLGIIVLGAVFLCTTGAEALYSDLGHCGRKNIYFTWCFVKIALILNYFGQGAALMHMQNTPLTGNPFFMIIPSWFIIPGLIITTCATVIASQSLISGSFTLVSEAVKLNFLPRMSVIYPSSLKGQLYIPGVNLFMWIGCISIVLHFQESAKMEAAYGLAITITMLMTTILLTQYLVMKHIHKAWIALLFTTYLAIEGTFLVANLFKFFHGGYITVLIAAIIVSVMYIWIKGYDIKTRFKKALKIKKFTEQLEKLKTDPDIPKFATNLVYLSEASRYDEVEDKVLYSILNKLPKRAENYWFVNIQVTDEPYTKEYSVNKISSHIYKVTFFLGFKVNQKINIFLRTVITDLLHNKELDPGSNVYSAIGDNPLGDFAFVIIREELSNQVELNIFDEYIMRTKLLIQRLTITPQKWFGLETSTVFTETIPMIRGIYRPVHIKRRASQI